MAHLAGVSPMTARHYEPLSAHGGTMTGPYDPYDPYEPQPPWQPSRQGPGWQPQRKSHRVRNALAGIG